MRFNYLSILLMLVIIGCNPSSEKIVYVHGHTQTCDGVEAQECLQIKEHPEQPWHSVYGSIEGFEPTEGFFYKLKVDVEKVPNPAADQSAIKYKLLKIVEQSTAPVILDGTWLVTKLDQREGFKRSPYVAIDLAQNKMQGNTGCNRFEAEMKSHPEKQILEVKSITTSEMQCGQSDVEKQFLKMLHRAHHYLIGGERLQFLDAHHQVVMELKFISAP